MVTKLIGRRRSAGNGRRGARIAISFAAIGAFLLSSGLVLVTQSGAGAAAALHSYVCKYVGKPGVNERLQTGGNPLWVSDSSITSRGGVVVAGASFNDAQGRSVVLIPDSPKLSPEPSVASCPAPIGPATASITVTPANCTTPTASFTATGTNATFKPPSGSGIVPSTTLTTSVSITGTADPGFAFSDGSTTKAFTADIPPFDPGTCKKGLTLTTANVVFTPTTCAGVGGYTTTAGTGVTYSVVSGSTAAGDSIRIKATADATHAFDAAGTQVEYFDNTFGPIPAACGVVGPGGGGLTLATPSVVFTDATCAGGLPGWVGTDTADIAYTASGPSVTGTAITVTASLIDPVTHAFIPGAQLSWPHTFATPTGCGGVVGPVAVPVVPLDPGFTDPTCADPTGARVTVPTVAGVVYTTTGTVAAGHTVDVDATAAPGVVLDPAAVKHWTHTFTTPTACGSVSPVHVVTGHGSTGHKPSHDAVVVPTVVHAGLIGAVPTAPSASGQLRELGIALALGGAMMLLGGGSWFGFALRRRGAGI